MSPTLDEGSAQLSSLMPERSETQHCSGRVFSPSLNTYFGQIPRATRRGRQETHRPVGVHVLLREKHHMEASPSSWPHAQRPHFLCVCFLESQPPASVVHSAVAFGTSGPTEDSSLVFSLKEILFPNLHLCPHPLPSLCPANLGRNVTRVEPIRCSRVMLCDFWGSVTGDAASMS